jgi:HD-like signal output (HDOD) protein
MKPTKEQFFVALQQIEKFSPAPVILANAMDLLRDPRSDIETIAALVGSDSALAADILRCANSAYYGVGTSTNIGDAVQRIGMRESIRLLNVAVARIASNRDLDCYGIHGVDYWAESLFNGLFMQAMARETGEDDPEEAYSVGLLRFIGRLAINQALDNSHSASLWDGSESITQWEIESVGMTQAQAGALLLGNWRFSQKVVQGIGMQYEPATLEQRNWLAEALFFSSTVLPQGIGRPFLPEVGPTWVVTPVGIEFMHRYGLNPDSVNGLLRTASESFDEIRRNFGV